jgi:HEAT repeat protein
LNSVASQDVRNPSQSEAIGSGLRDKNVDARRGAAEILRQSDRKAQRAALPVLIDLLKDEKDGQVRLAVLDVVTALGPDAAPAVPALVHTLRTRYGGSRQEESHQDYRSALALAAIGKPAVDGLRGLLGESKAGVRAEAVMGLGRIGPDARAAVPELIGLLSDPEEVVGREVSLALGRIGESAVESLIAAASQENPAIRARAVESLGTASNSDDRVRRTVSNAAGDTSPRVRAAALKSLARLEPPHEVLLPILKENLRHEDQEVRMSAVDLLMKRRDLLPILGPELGDLLTARNPDVSRVAAFLLGKIGPPAAPRLIAAIRGKEGRIDQIALGLAAIGRPIAGMLDDALKDPEPRVRRGAALALGRIRPMAPGTSQRLAAGLNAPEPEVRADLVTAIGYLGPRAADAVPAVRGVLRDDSPEVRSKAIEFLARAAPRDGRLVADLISMLDDPEARIECAAIDIIRSLGPLSRDALPAVIGKLKSPSADVRLAAAVMVKDHGPAAAPAVPALITLLDDPATELKAGAAQSLGMIGPPAQPAFDKLAALLSSDQPGIRESAVAAIGSLALDAEIVRPPFQKALRDEKPNVRRAATRAIQKLGPKGSIFVADIILMAEKKENRRSVERLLRRFENQEPDARSLPELIKQLDHSEDAVRLLAIRFLALAGEHARDAIPALERMHDDPSVEVRKQAEAACKRIKKDSARG